MSICSRCNSENNADIKFCNFCGSRMRATLSMDCFGTLALKPAETDIFAEDVPVNNKLAYRYFIKGRQAFSAGDFSRATLMFSCALDANPSDEKVKAFLKRAREMKEETSRRSVRTFSPEVLQAGMPFDPELKLVQPLVQDVSHVVKIDNSFSSEPIDMAPLLNFDFQKTTVSPRLSEFSSSIEKNPPAEILRPDFSAVPSWEKHTSTKEHVGADDDEFFRTIPSSPAELLDNAPEESFWNDIAATVAAIAGVIVFGLVLTL